MLNRYSSLPLPMGGLVLSLLGLVFCLAVASGVGNDALCFTEGCALIKEITVWGISLWWFGVAAFALLSLICFFRQRALAYLFASLFLLVDCALLILMFFLAPCVNCLVAGLLFFCVWMALSWRSSSMLVSPRIVHSGLSVIWGFLFVLNAATAVSQAVPLWSMPHQTSSKITVFFSPSCPACRKAIDVFGSQAVFYGVAENEEDLAMLWDIETRLRRGQQLDRAMKDICFLQEAGQYVPPALPFWEKSWLRLKTLRNQAAIQRSGFKALPVILFEGLPLALTETGNTGKTANGATGAPEAANASDAADVPVDFGKTLECGQHSAEPCEQTPADAAPAPDSGAASGQTGVPAARKTAE